MFSRATETDSRRTFGTRECRREKRIKEFTGGVGPDSNEKKETGRAGAFKKAVRRYPRFPYRGKKMPAAQGSTKSTDPRWRQISKCVLLDLWG